MESYLYRLSRFYENLIYDIKWLYRDWLRYTTTGQKIFHILNICLFFLIIWSVCSYFTAFDSFKEIVEETNANLELLEQELETLK